MLGQGMPWHIILVFFFLGLAWGVNNAKKEYRKELENTAKDENSNGI